MNRSVVGILAGAALALSYAQPAAASSFLSVGVAGSASLTCDNSTAAGVTACSGSGFTTSLGSNSISFTGTIGTVSFTNVTLLGNQPGNDIEGAFSTDTKTAVRNNSTTTNASVTVTFASSGYTNPAGSPVLFNATQGMDAISSQTALTSNFTGYGTSGNNLVPGTGSFSATPPCNTVATTGGVGTNSCSTNGPLSSFARLDPTFSLSGVESFILTPLATVNVHGSILASATAVPEPASMLLLGTGLLALGRRVRRRARA